MHRQILLNILLITLLVTATSCLKTTKEPSFPSGNEQQKGRIYVECEGLWGLNQASLVYINFATNQISYNWFEQVNNRKLGDIANDLQRYGSKIYGVISSSSLIEVMDIDGRSIKQIPVRNGAVAREPRYIAFDKDKAYICNFDGTLQRIDTTTLEIEATVKCGRFPDGIAIARNKIYVSNSGGADYPNYDTTVSVIDIERFKEIKRIEVGTNPGQIKRDNQQNIYVVTRGNYGNENYKFHRIDTQSDIVSHTYAFQVYQYTIVGDILYYYVYDYNTGAQEYKRVDLLDAQPVPQLLIKQPELIEKPYSIDIDPTNGDLYIADALDYLVKGNLLCFSKEGDFKFQISQIGICPNKTLFLP